MTKINFIIGFLFVFVFSSCSRHFSEEELNSYVKQNDSLQAVIKNSFDSIEESCVQIEKAMLINRKSVQPYYDSALRVKLHSHEMYNYLEGIKKFLFYTEEKNDTINLSVMKNKGEYTVPTHYFLSEADTVAPEGSKAYELKQKIKAYKIKLFNYTPKHLRRIMHYGMDISNKVSSETNKEESWEILEFYHKPAVRVLSYLTSLQNDVNRNEKEILFYLNQSAVAAIDSTK